MFYKKRRGKSIYSVFSETQESPNPALILGSSQIPGYSAIIDQQSTASG